MGPDTSSVKTGAKEDVLMLDGTRKLAQVIQQSGDRQRAMLDRARQALEAADLSKIPKRNIYLQRLESSETYVPVITQEFAADAEAIKVPETVQEDQPGQPGTVDLANEIGSIGQIFRDREEIMENFNKACSNTADANNVRYFLQCLFMHVAEDKNMWELVQDQEKRVETFASHLNLSETDPNVALFAGVKNKVTPLAEAFKTLDSQKGFVQALQVDAQRITNESMDFYKMVIGDPAHFTQFYLSGEVTPKEELPRFKELVQGAMKNYAIYVQAHLAFVQEFMRMTKQRSTASK